MSLLDAADPASAEDAVLPIRQRRWRPSVRYRILTWTLRIALPVVAVLIWQWTITTGRANPLFVGRPEDVYSFLVHQTFTSTMGRDLWATLKETLIGYVFGSSLGILFGWAISRFTVLYDALNPYFTALNSLPRIALAPLFLLWFGIGTEANVVLVISLVFFILMSSTHGALGNVDPDLVRLARGLGFNGPRTFIKVLLPWATPGIFAGLQLGLVYAFLGAVAGEMIAARAGIGQRLQYYAGTFQTSALIGTLVVLAVVATALTMAMDVLRRRLLRYRNH